MTKYDALLEKIINICNSLLVLVRKVKKGKIMFWGILLLDLIITAFAYLLVPVIFSLIGKEMSQKQIKKVIIVNSAIVWLIFNVISINQGEDAALHGVLVWSAVGYYIMKKKCMLNKTDASLSDNQDFTSVDGYNVYDYEEQCEQYRQNINNTKPKHIKILPVTILSVVTLISLVVNIGVIAACMSQKDRIESLEESNSKFQAQNSDLKDELEKYETNYSILERAKVAIQDKANFLDEYIVFVLDGYGNYYYTYDQVQIVTEDAEGYGFWAYGETQAIDLGYKAWK